MRRYRRRENGFTLLEMLAVIGIIGIVAALLLPAISKVKAQVRSTTCRNRLRQMGLGLQMYVQENQGRYPYSISTAESPGTDAEIPANALSIYSRFWFAKLEPYYPARWTNAAYHCPGYKGPIKGVEIGETNSVGPHGSYAYNSKGVRIGRSVYTNPATGILILYPRGDFGLGPRQNAYDRPRAAVSENPIARPSDMMAIGESRFLDLQVNGWAGGGLWEMICGALNSKTFAFDPARHGKNYNLVFCDGHVSGMNPRVLFNPTNTARMWNYDHQPHPELWVP